MVSDLEPPALLDPRDHQVLLVHQAQPVELGVREVTAQRVPPDHQAQPGELGVREVSAQRVPPDHQAQPGELEVREVLDQPEPAVYLEEVRVVPIIPHR